MMVVTLIRPSLFLGKKGSGIGEWVGFFDQEIFGPTKKHELRNREGLLTPPRTIMEVENGSLQE